MCNRCRKIFVPAPGGAAPFPFPRGPSRPRLFPCFSMFDKMLAWTVACMALQATEALWGSLEFSKQAQRAEFVCSAWGWWRHRRTRIFGVSAIDQQDSTAQILSIHGVSISRESQMIPDARCLKHCWFGRRRTRNASSHTIEREGVFGKSSSSFSTSEGLHAPPILNLTNRLQS